MKHSFIATIIATIVASCFMFATRDVVAQQINAPTLYESSTAGMPALKLRGGGLLRMFGFQIYNSYLWTPDGAAFDVKKPFVLDIQYLRNFEGKKLAERSIDEMRAQNVGSDAVYPKWLAEMVRVFPDVKPNDRLTGVFTTNRTAKFFHNGKLTGEVNDPEFADAFFGIWLSANTSQPKLRALMLGNSN
ncbi:MAG: chalcone isomerase family protein [Casimicrobium sp.]